MFFLPWAIGIVIMVLACIAGVVFIRVLPLWFGGLLGVGIVILWEQLMKVENMLTLALTFMFAPAIVLAIIYRKMSSKNEQSIKSDLIATVVNLIVTLPFTSLATWFIFSKFFSPTEYRAFSPYADYTSGSFNLEQWQKQIDTYHQAVSVSSDIAFLCIAGFISITLICLFALISYELFISLRSFIKVLSESKRPNGVFNWQFALVILAFISLFAYRYYVGN